MRDVEDLSLSVTSLHRSALSCSSLVYYLSRILLVYYISYVNMYLYSLYIWDVPTNKSSKGIRDSSFLLSQLATHSLSLSYSYGSHLIFLISLISSHNHLINH